MVAIDLMADGLSKASSISWCIPAGKMTPTLEPSLFSDLGIRKPDQYLGIDCENLNELTGQVMVSLRALSPAAPHGCGHRGRRPSLHHGSEHRDQEAGRAVGSHRRGYPLLRHLDA